MKHNVGSLGRWCIRLSWIYLVAVVLYLPLNIWALATHGAFGATLENAALGVPTSVWLVAEWLGYGIAAAFVASMIASLFWIYRSSANARQIDPDVRRIGPTMAVVWWLIPIAQYWMPLGVMRQTWNSCIVWMFTHANRSSSTIGGPVGQLATS